MILISANNAQTVLGAGLTPSTTTVILSSGAGSLFPSPGSGQFFTLTLNGASAATQNVYEICYCTARTGDSLTVTRGQEGTTPRTWNIGDFAYNTLTAGTEALFVQGGPFLPLTGGNLAGPGNLTVGGGLNVTGGVGVTGGLNVAGATGLKAVTATTVQTTGNVTVGGNLEVTAGFLSSFATNLNVGAAVVQITNSLGSALNTLNVAPGTVGNEAVNIAQFGFATGGVARFPVGSGTSFIIEWGTFIVNSGGSIQDFNYAATFPNACLAVMACYQAATPPLTGAVGIQPVNTVGFAAIDTSPGGSSHGCNYIALGY